MRVAAFRFGWRIIHPGDDNCSPFEWLGTAAVDADDLLDGQKISDPRAVPFPPKLRRSTSLICDINSS